jgi:hypothetical protein
MQSLPFTQEQFFEVFVRYNLAVWPAQLALLGLAVACLFLVRANRAQAAAAILAALWSWMALGYHFAFFSSINPAAIGFGVLFLGGAALFVWVGVVRARLRFEPCTSRRAIAGRTLILYALVGYPALGYALGHAYPAAPTFGLPCPTTIFTLGVLLLAEPVAPRALFVVPLLWSVVGTAGAIALGVPEDYGLFVAAALALALGVAPARASGASSVGE